MFSSLCHGPWNGNLQGSQQQPRRGRRGRLHKFINCRRRRSFHALSTSQHFKYAKLMITFSHIFSFLHNREDFWMVGFYTGLDRLDKGWLADFSILVMINQLGMMHTWFGLRSSETQFLCLPLALSQLKFIDGVSGFGSGGNPQMVSSHLPPNSPCQSVLPQEIPPPSVKDNPWSQKPSPLPIQCQ